MNEFMAAPCFSWAFSGCGARGFSLRWFPLLQSAVSGSTGFSGWGTPAQKPWPWALECGRSHRGAWLGCSTAGGISQTRD